LRAAEVKFLNDPANSHLFEEPITESDQNEKPKKKRKQPEKRKGKSEKASNPTKKKKEPELVCTLKWYCDQKNNSLFSLDFKSMLSKYQLTQVLSSDFEKTPVYFNWNVLIYWSAITNFKILRELGREENDIKDALV